MDFLEICRVRLECERPSSKLASSFLAIGLATLGLGACNAKNEYVPPPPPKVSVAQPARQDVTSYFELTGNTVAFRSVDLAARVQGFLDSIDYEDGAAVTQGSQLFGVRPDTYQAQLDQARGSLDAAEATKVSAQADYERQVALGKQDFASQARVEQAKAELDKASAAVTQARAGLELATINLGYTRLLAPFDGVVTHHLVDVGALVGVAGPTKLATIVQTDPIYVYFNISEPQVIMIKESLAAQGRILTRRDLPEIDVEIGLQGEDGYPHRGHLDYLSPRIDAATGTLVVRGLFENKDNSLLPGMFARVRVPIARRQNALLVRDDAIGTNQEGSYVLVLGRDDVITQKQVKTGSRQGRLRIVESGLDAADWVLTEGIQRAAPGSKVTPEKTEMAADEGTAASPGKTGTP